MAGQREMHGSIEVLEPKPRKSLGINEAQAIQGWWEKNMGIDESPLQQAHRLEEEIREFSEAVRQSEINPSRKNILATGKEAADIFIFAVGIINRLGLDIENLIRQRAAFLPSADLQSPSLSLTRVQEIAAERQLILGNNGSSSQQIQILETLYLNLLQKTQEFEQDSAACTAHCAGGYMLDMAIFSLEIINRLGLDAEELFTTKLERNHHKYNVVRAQELISQGLHPQQARKRMKEEWTGD